MSRRVPFPDGRLDLRDQVGRNGMGRLQLDKEQNPFVFIKLASLPHADGVVDFAKRLGDRVDIRRAKADSRRIEDAVAMKGSVSWLRTRGGWKRTIFPTSRSRRCLDRSAQNLLDTRRPSRIGQSRTLRTFSARRRRRMRVAGWETAPCRRVRQVDPDPRWTRLSLGPRRKYRWPCPDIWPGSRPRRRGAVGCPRRLSIPVSISSADPSVDLQEPAISVPPLIEIKCTRGGNAVS